MQYDVELLQKIEALVGHQLQAFSMDEKEVLKGITGVYKARRNAALLLAEQDSRAEQAGRRLHAKAAKKLGS